MYVHMKCEKLINRLHEAKNVIRLQLEWGSYHFKNVPTNNGYCQGRHIDPLTPPLLPRLS